MFRMLESFISIMEETPNNLKSTCGVIHCLNPACVHVCVHACVCVFVSVLEKLSHDSEAAFNLLICKPLIH